MSQSSAVAIPPPTQNPSIIAMIGLSKASIALRERATAAGTEVEVLGPLPAYVARRAGKWRFHIVLRGSDPLSLLGGDPGAPWSVDVDPESLL